MDVCIGLLVGFEDLNGCCVSVVGDTGVRVRVCPGWAKVGITFGRCFLAGFPTHKSPRFVNRDTKRGPPNLMY